MASRGILHRCNAATGYSPDASQATPGALGRANITLPEIPSNADDPVQSQRFIDMARQVGADEKLGSVEIFEDVVRRLGASPKEPHRAKARPSKKR